MIKIKRVYDAMDPADGVRFLVDRLWPRGVGKEAVNADFWLKNVAPSAELRKWFAHDPVKWDEFCRKYFSELKANPRWWKPIVAAEREGVVTLLYSASDEKHNNAAALRRFLMDQSTGTGEETC